MASKPRPAQRPNAPRLETISETQARTGIPERFLRRLVHERRIPFFKIGRRVFLRVSEVDDWIATQRVEPLHTIPVRPSAIPGDRPRGRAPRA